MVASALVHHAPAAVAPAMATALAQEQAQPPEAPQQQLRTSRRRIVSLVLMLLVPIAPTAVLSAFSGAELERAAGDPAAELEARRTLFLHMGLLAAVCMAACTTAISSVVYGWRLYPRDWPAAAAAPLAVFAAVYAAGSAAVAARAPAALLLPFAPPVLHGALLTPAFAAVVAAWSWRAHRRLRRATPAPGEDGDDGEVGMQEAVAAELATPVGAARLSLKLVAYVTALLLCVFDMWGYLFLLALCSPFPAAQALVSLAFSILSFGVTASILRVFRGFLGAILPEKGGEAFCILFFLHTFRTFRLMSSFRVTSYPVLAFGVAADVASALGPLLAGRLPRRLAQALAGLVQRAASSKPASPDEEAALARDGGRALFFLQGLASVFASLHFLASVALLRFGRAAALFPYHPAVLPSADYAACALAAASSAVDLAICLAGARLLGARRREVLDGFALGWEVVDRYGPRVACMWVAGPLCAVGALFRTYNIFSHVYPAAYAGVEITAGQL